MELGEAVDRISWGEWNWKVILVGTRPLEICSSLKLYTDLLTVIKAWSGTGWGFEPCVRESLLQRGSKKSHQWIPDTGMEQARNESSTVHCTAEKSAPSALSARAKPNPNLPPAPKAFLQNWDNNCVVRHGYRGKNSPPSLCFGPCWAGIKKRGSLQPSSDQCDATGDGGNQENVSRKHPGLECREYSGHFLLILQGQGAARLKHEVSSWPGVWRQVFPSVPGKGAGSFLGSRHSFHSCICGLQIGEHL